MILREGTDRGVSEVVGEMLMVALVIVLLAALSAALYHYLPPDRDPSVTIRVSNDAQNITFWHKGGDWVRAEDVTVVIGNESRRFTYIWDHSPGSLQREGNFTLVPDKSVFDLGSNLTVVTGHDLEGNETVRLITSRSVLFTGGVRL
jgi:FlaG/FlaF family flagellin (archaellin)